MPAGPPREPVADQPGLERDAWTQLDLPAICERASVAIGPGEVHHRAVGDVLHPEREPLVELERLRATMGSQALAAQYQQAPVPAEGTMIRAWLRRYGVPPVRRPDDLIVQSWDTASKPGEIHDFSVCTTWLVQGRQCYLLEVFRERLAYPELRRAVLRLSREHDASAVLIEDTGSGIHLIHDLARSGELFPIACTPAGDKVMRLHAQSVRFEAGEVLLPERAPWLDDFLDELLAFPGGRYDDQVDALIQALVSGDTTN